MLCYHTCLTCRMRVYWGTIISCCCCYTHLYYLSVGIHVSRACVCVSSYLYSVSLLWECVPSSRAHLHICIYQRAVSQCSLFTVYVTGLLCHPTLPIITHKKETAHIPWDRHIQHTNKNNKERSLWTCRQCILLITSSSDASYVLLENTNWFSWRPSHCRHYHLLYWLACLSQICRQRNNMWCCVLSMRTCSADAAWGRIFCHNLHKLNLKPLWRLSSR